MTGTIEKDRSEPYPWYCSACDREGEVKFPEDTDDAVQPMEVLNQIQSEHLKISPRCLGGLRELYSGSKEDYIRTKAEWDLED
jgi:hypothetical protein